MQEPPEPILGNGMRVEGRYKEVDEVQGEGEVEDEFRARDEEEDSYHSVFLSAILDFHLLLCIVA